MEVHDRDELRVALAIGAEIVGINNRDLRDFSVDVERTERLLDDVPRGVTVVSESGIAQRRAAAQAERARRAGGAGGGVADALGRSGGGAEDVARAGRERRRDIGPRSAPGII